jgi:L-ascorbate metabolism protein UlaG (beta-lactamase superfamily)
MDITSLGHSSFRIHGKIATVVTDPFDSAFIGLKFPKHVAADIVTVSHGHEDHNATSQIEDNPFIVSGPGEYEIRGVGIVGIASHHDAEKKELNTIYRIEIEDLSIVHLGDLGRMLTSEEIDELDGVDILMIPVGGTYTIDATLAAKLASEIDPSIVIPMHYQRPGLKFDLAPVSAFLKEMGQESVTAQPKLSIAKSKLPEQKQVVVLE